MWAKLGRPRWSSRRGISRKAVLDEVVRRIVAVAQPDQIILFGSAARGQLRAHSDFDLLVIKEEVADPRALTRHIHSHLFGIPMPIDVIVVTPDMLREARNKMWTLLGRAQHEGKRIYTCRW